jgi:hypothetical protein
MDRLKDRLAALAEEVGELTQPPGAAVTVWRARRRRRRVLAKVAGVGLFSVVVVGLLLNPPGRGFPDADTPRPFSTSSPPTTHRPRIGPMYYAPRGIAPGERLQVVGSGCDPIQQGEIAIDRLGIRKSARVNKDGSYSVLLRIPRTAKAGTYDVTSRCLPSESGNDGIVGRDPLVVTKPKK